VDPRSGIVSIDQHTEIDEGKLMQFVFRAVGEVGAALNAALVVMGDKLGLYQALAEAGPLTPDQRCERFFRPGYNANLISQWLPALDGVVGQLDRGARVADVGCGHGSSTILMAQAFPDSTFVGTDYHDGSIRTAQQRARDAGVDGRVRFETAAASAYEGDGYDLVTVFDCLHDMGDPLGAARHVHGSLKPDGTWMIVEPYAEDRIEGNFNPVGRAYYAFSTLLCTPASLSQEVGLALGAQAGEARIRDVVTAAGFTRFRRAAETPFNIVFEARP
jgi:SAM-dependent methyltransferase